MKKFQKLDEKKIASPDAIKGGLMALQPEFSLDASGEGSDVTTHTPTQKGDVYLCDHKTDPR